MKKSSYFYPFLSLFTRVHVKVYPVFRPNDYFWENHWGSRTSKGGVNEQQWQLYCRVLREEVMSKAFDFRLSNSTAESKNHFVDILYDKFAKIEKDSDKKGKKKKQL